MSRAPFKNFIVLELLYGAGVAQISEKLRNFGYICEDVDIISIFNELKHTLPEDMRDLVIAKAPLNMSDAKHIEVLMGLGVWEFYDYINFTKNQPEKLPESPPVHFKWCEDCLWIQDNSEIMVLINILLFNGDVPEDISKVIKFKYRKNISSKVVELYKRMFWSTDEIDAKEAMDYCHHFKNNAVIIRYLKSGELEVEKADMESGEESDGSDVPFTFHNSEYIKWKIGFKDVKIPDSRSFLEDVKRDNYFRYYEVQNMNQSVEREVEEESGSNDKIGAFDRKLNRKRFRNVEEQRAKLSKHYFDEFVKADTSALKGDGSSNKEFFKKMSEIDLKFKEDEKVVRAEDVKDLLTDIAGDIIR